MNGGCRVVSYQPRPVIMTCKKLACFAVTLNAARTSRTMHLNCKNWSRALDGPCSTFQYWELISFRVYFENVYLCKFKIVKFLHSDLNGLVILEAIMKWIQTACSISRSMQEKSPNFLTIRQCRLLDPNVIRFVQFKV